MAQNYEGYVDSKSCTAITGWAADKSIKNYSIQVALSFPGNFTLHLAANPRPDVGTFLGDNGLHGFTIPVPEAAKMGQSVQIDVLFTNGKSIASFLLTCPSSTTPPPPDNSYVKGCLTGLELPYNIYVPFKKKYVAGEKCLPGWWDADDNYLYFCNGDKQQWKKLRWTE